MKMIKLAALLVAAGFASSAYAANQGGGKIEFYGDIIAAPCSVAPQSVDQRIPMGQVSNRILANGGENKTETFYIQLNDCSFEPVGTPGEGETTASLPLDNHVKVTFGGTAVETNGQLLALLGKAKGAGIQLHVPGKGPITLGQKVPMSDLAAGDNTLVFAANLRGISGETVVPGDFTATTTFALEYN